MRPPQDEACAGAASPSVGSTVLFEDSRAFVYHPGDLTKVGRIARRSAGLPPEHKMSRKGSVSLAFTLSHLVIVVRSSTAGSRGAIVVWLSFRGMRVACGVLLARRSRRTRAMIGLSTNKCVTSAKTRCP